MRVTVQIDDERPGSTPAPDGGPQAVAPLPPSSAAATPSPIGSPPSDVSGGAPSPELAARAARLGAISAGPAPSAPPPGATGAPGFAVEGLGTPAAGAPGAAPDAPEDHSAGPAPVELQAGP